MSFIFKLSNTVYWLALVFWIGCLLAAGTAAIGVFSTLPEMNIQLEQFQQYNPDEHGNLAAGKVMEPIFTAVDFLQMVVAPIVILMVVFQLTVFGMRWSSPANLTRTVCILGAAILLGVHVFVYAPRMNHELRAYWQAAEAGNVVAAQTHRAAFEVDHRIADPLMNVRLGLLLIAVIASAAAFTPAQKTEEARLEQPQLSQKTHART